ncbi:MAG: methyltransferase, partial [Candidatus Binatia bacterium]
ARIVQAAVELKIFDAVGSGAPDARTVAKSLDLEWRATELMLNALAALKLLDKQAERFSLTQVSAKYLIRSAPEYLGGMIRFDAALWRLWEQLADAVRTGQPVRATDMYQDHPAETEIFIGAMDSLVKARGDAEVIATIFEWEKVTKLLDIGSGPATYPISLCRKYPKIRATIFDLPATMAITERYVREAALEERIQLIRGDYRIDKIPGSYDVIFLSNIIHGEGIEENQRLITSLCSILKPGGSIIVKDHILDGTRVSPPVGAIFSLLMLLTTGGGRCYSFDEIKRWMEMAGLAHVQQIDLLPPLTSSLVIATQ